MKIATFNANSVRVRLPIILDWLATNEPDILAIQETKCEDHNFPADDFHDIGYHIEFHGQKSYNGVAIASKAPMNNVQRGFDLVTMPTDCRVLRAEVDGISILNTYVPNGSKVGSEKWAYKMAWLEHFQSVAKGMMARGPWIWLGDINIAPTPDDVYEPERKLGEVGHHPDEFSRLAAITDHGLTDCFRKHTQGPGHHTYWDFFIKNALDRKLGWRIDHIYASPEIESKCTACTIDYEPRRAERPSDHTFVMAEFDL